MSESCTLDIDVARWRAALLAVKRAVLDCEPVAALERLDRLLDDLAARQTTLESV
jgi:hypothetical protein